MSKFYIQSGYTGKEVPAIMFSYNREDLKFSAISEYDGEIPVGSVEFVESIIGVKIPNYYPSFLNDNFYRNIRLIESIEELDDEESVFIKPADRHKRYDALIVSGIDKYAPIYYEWQVGPHWASSIVHFKEEWRYYVSNGKVLAAYWYLGEEKEIEAPLLGDIFPPDFCGAVDFGRLNNGKLALVENNLPYACGWYGPCEEGKIYGDWLERSFLYLKNIS